MAVSFARGDVSGQVIEPARACDDGLLGGKPTVRPDAPRDGFPTLDLWVLDIHGSHAELPVTNEALVMMGHVVLDQIR